MTASRGLPDAVTNRIFSVTLQLGGRTCRSSRARLVVRPLLMSAGKQVGAVGMAVDAELDRATGCVTLEPDKPVTVAFLLERRERCRRCASSFRTRRPTPSCTARPPTSRFDLECKHMSNGAVPARDALDDKVNRLFAGKVVRKDLVRKVKVGANVPVFVLEFLLGKYCASSDEVAIQMGLQVVNDTLANNYIRPDESMKAQSKVKENGQVHLHRQGEGAPRRLRLLGRGRQLRQQVPAHPDAVRPRLRAPADGRRLGAGRHALRVRRGDRRARTRSGSTSSRRSRSRPSTSRSTGASGASSRPTSGSTSWCAAWATSRARCRAG